MDPSVHNLDCQEVEDLLPLIVDGVIDEESDPNVFAHLVGCPSCQTSLATYDLIDLVLSDGRHISKPQTVPSKVIHYRIPGLWTAAAALMAAVGIGVWLNQGEAPLVKSSPAPTNTVKILEVLPNHGNQNQPAFVIQDGDTIRVISGEQLDGGVSDRPPHGTQAVSNERFQIRQVGSID